MAKEIMYGFVPSQLDGSEHKYDGVKGMKIPDSYSYEKYLPKVIDQGMNPICVPCSISAFINWNINVDNKKDNSSDHKVDLFGIYKAKSNSGEGMSFKDALKHVRHNGVKTDNGVEKIERYAMVGSAEALKRALISNGPCLGALPVYDDTAKEFWSDRTKKQFLGGHAISIVGYDNEGFIIRNSWGERFGNKGYVKLKYSDFGKFFEVWTIIA